jgi:hypothetical protein
MSQFNQSLTPIDPYNPYNRNSHVGTIVNAFKKGEDPFCRCGDCRECDACEAAASDILVASGAAPAGWEVDPVRERWFGNKPGDMWIGGGITVASHGPAEFLRLTGAFHVPMRRA